MVALGCLSVLRKKEWLSGVAVYHGTSSGSVIAAGLVHGRSCKKMMRAILERPLLLQAAQWNLFGLHSGGLLEDFVSHVTGISPGTTFADLHRQTGKTLVVSVCNLTSKRPEQWSHESHPDVSVVLALRISCSIPLVFQAVEFGKHVYVDGAVGEPVPSTRSPGTTLSVRFVNTKTSMDSLSDFLGALVSVQARPGARFDVALDPGDTHALAFDIRGAEATSAYRSGKKQAYAFIKKNL